MVEATQKNAVKCEECGVAFFTFGHNSVCPKCQDRNYFNCIREFIEDEKPTVEELSSELHVPKIRIYRWIKDGRIQYIPGTGMTGLFCEVCGEPIQFGSICVKCAKKARGKKSKKEKVVAV